MNAVKRMQIAVLMLSFASGPAFAQMDFSGEWTVVRAMDNTENPYLGEWFGLPLNEAGRARAESWNAAIQSLPEWQCRPHGWAYIYRGPTALRITKEVDPVSREIKAFQGGLHSTQRCADQRRDKRQGPRDGPAAWWCENANDMVEVTPSCGRR